MPDDLDIYNESDDFQRGDDDEDEDDELVKKIKNDPEYLQMMNYLMFVNGP
jgi:hypothetical protein